MSVFCLDCHWSSNKSWVKATDAYVKSYDIYGETKKIKVESRFGLSLFITNLVITSSLGRSPCV